MREREDIKRKDQEVNSMEERNRQRKIGIDRQIDRKEEQIDRQRQKEREKKEGK